MNRTRMIVALALTYAVFGLRRAMIAALGLVAIACLAMPLVPGFWTTRLMFLAVGVAFGVTKVSVYSFVGLLTDDSARHASLLILIEGVFMLGVLSGYWIFAAYIDPQEHAGLQWLHVYYALAAASLVALALLAVTPFDESAVDAPAAHGAGRKVAEMDVLDRWLL